jgi:cytochrome c biogenesis protein CcmG, thiol:disulfide interchange protein DsbE
VGRGLSVAVIAAAALFLAVLVYGVSSQGRDTSIDQALSDGKRVAAPLASLQVLGGEGKRSLAEFDGKVVVLNFWASWCPPCVDELPLLERTQRRLETRDATVLGINYKDIPEDALDFTRRFKLTYPNLRDRDGEYAQRYGARAFPETFVIDRRGRIAALRRGPVDQKWLDQTLARLLSERS